MAKKVKKELTQEERLQHEKEHGLSMIKMELPFIPEPTYTFSIGDKVQYGSLKESVVDDVLYDGKVYGLKCIATDNNYGDPYDYEKYSVVAWHEIRPMKKGNSDFTRNEDVKLYFSNVTISSLIHKRYSFGIDMNPDYQRDYVWEENDKELLLDSIFKNIDIGKFVLVKLSDDEFYEKGFSYEILDGKQRLRTLCDFYENRIQYNGKYYNDLSWKDQRTFKEG
jgi:hypothetical protein